MSESDQAGRRLVVVLAPVAMVLLLATVAAFWAAGRTSTIEQSVAPEAPLSYVTNSLGMKFVRIPAGEFTMGDERLGFGPERKVRVGGFLMGVHEVTQAQWQAVMGYNPSRFPGPQRPVEQVSWLDVQSFLEQLNIREGTNRYRLPTEAEWEYAARAGSQSRFFFGDDINALRRFAWFGANENRGTRAVGSLRPSPWGLYDIYGNVWEYVQDCWHEDYRNAPPDARAWGGVNCQLRGLRGGGWNNRADTLGSAVRGSYDARFGDISNGFRVVLMER